VLFGVNLFAVSPLPILTHNELFTKSILTFAIVIKQWCKIDESKEIKPQGDRFNVENPPNTRG
jgi:hypothetical protein